jgi:hypothetical protein
VTLEQGRGDADTCKVAWQNGWHGNRRKLLNAKASDSRGGVMTEQSEGLSGKGRKRHAVKAATGQGVGKVKATIHLSIEAAERLGIHAIKMNMDRSELVEWLIEKYLRRWVVSDRGGTEGAAGGEAAA